MNKECEKCIYYVLEPDIDSSYYMCDNKNYKSSFPEFTGYCPYFKSKLNVLRYKVKVDYFDSNNHFKRWSFRCNHIEIINNSLFFHVDERTTHIIDIHRILEINIQHVS